MAQSPAEAREEFQSYRAFRAWFREATQGNLDVGARIIYEMARDASGGIAWLLLTATGDSAFTEETFRKAAGLALDTPDEEPRDKESGPSVGYESMMPRGEGEGWE